MPSYTQYMRQMAVMDANDDDIESWITVKGNHIPIKKGQSKEDAVKSFIEKKGGKSGEKESKYDPEFETVRKNALANGNVYGGKYTQKSKAEAYKEYKNDTSSKENMQKANAFVNSEHVDKPKNTFLSNPNTLKEFANHFGISESAAKNAAEKYGDEFYNTMVKDPMKGVAMAVGGEVPGKKENGRKERPVHISEALNDVVAETKEKMENNARGHGKPEHYAHKWESALEPHNLTNKELEDKLSLYRSVRVSRPDDNELIDKINDIKHVLELRQKKD